MTNFYSNNWKEIPADLHCLAKWNNMHMSRGSILNPKRKKSEGMGLWAQSQVNTKTLIIARQTYNKQVIRKKYGIVNPPKLKLQF